MNERDRNLALMKTMDRIKDIYDSYDGALIHVTKAIELIEEAISRMKKEVER